MLDCWSFDPKSRPTFKSLVQRVETVRGSKDGWAPPIPQPLTPSVTMYASRTSWSEEIRGFAAANDLNKEGTLQPTLKSKRGFLYVLVVLLGWSKRCAAVTLQEAVFSLLFWVCSLRLPLKWWGNVPAFFLTQVQTNWADFLLTHHTTLNFLKTNEEMYGGHLLQGDSQRGALSGLCVYC